MAGHRPSHESRASRRITKMDAGGNTLSLGVEPMMSDEYKMDDMVGDALQLLQEISTGHEEDFKGGDDDDVEDTVRIKTNEVFELDIQIFEAELEALSQSKQLRDTKREQLRLLGDKYDAQEREIKDKMMGDGMSGNDDLQQKLTEIRRNKKKLEKEREKQENMFRFEDDKYEQDMKEITNKLTKYKDDMNGGKDDKIEEEEQQQEEEAIDIAGVDLHDENGDAQ